MLELFVELSRNEPYCKKKILRLLRAHICSGAGEVLLSRLMHEAGLFMQGAFVRSGIALAVFLFVLVNIAGSSPLFLL